MLKFFFMYKIENKNDFCQILKASCGHHLERLKMKAFQEYCPMRALQTHSKNEIQFNNFFIQLCPHFYTQFSLEGVFFCLNVFPLYSMKSGTAAAKNDVTLVNYRYLWNISIKIYFHPMVNTTQIATWGIGLALFSNHIWIERIRKDENKIHLILHLKLCPWIKLLCVEFCVGMKWISIRNANQKVVP